MTRILPLVPLALLNEDGALLTACYRDMEALLKEHDTGDTMRRDWCCMTHGMPCNICNGTNWLCRVAKTLQVLRNTPLAFPCSKAYNLMHMLRYCYSPTMYRGQGLSMMTNICCPVPPPRIVPAPMHPTGTPT
ncbi:MAG: hypothetical protein E7324_01660 [Clostridiales bacterium]|nr:hypothetical protein [Clostridiales bacterium]